MKMTSRTLLAAALMMALPVGSAMACTVSAWNGSGTATTAANAGGPGDGVARYSGECALTAANGEYVIDNSPGNEPQYRARFYVLTGNASGPVTVFKATDGNDGSGSAVIEVDFTGSAFEFRQNGTAVGSGVSGVESGKWYSVELFYNKDTEFTASVAGGGSEAELGSVSGSAGAGTISSAVLGVSAGSAGSNFNFDSFESTRSEDEIGRLCRGDANNDGQLSVQDVVAITSEIGGSGLAAGQPDANEDGAVSVADIPALIQRIGDVDSCQ